MSSVSPAINPVKIVLSDTLGQVIRNIVQLSKPYRTIILLYEDEVSDTVQAAWAELDRLQLKTKIIGEILDGIEVHSFGLDDFPAGTVLEVNLRETSMDANRQDALRAAYKSLLNELCLISVKVHRHESGTMLLQ